MFPILATRLKDEGKDGIRTYTAGTALWVESVFTFALSLSDREMRERLVRKAMPKISSNLVPEDFICKPLYDAAKAVLSQGRP